MWAFLKSRNNKSGFMLLEVILSVFIVTVGVVFVIGSFITSIKALRSTRSYLEALHLLEERMWEFEETGAIEEGNDSGRFEDHEYAEWEVEAEELEDLPLNEMTLEVILKKEGRERTFKISTYLYNEDTLGL